MPPQAAQATALREAPWLSAAHAMRSKAEAEAGDGEREDVWDCGSPLYDSHELASLGHLLERNTMALPVSSSGSELSSSSENGGPRSAVKAEAFRRQRSSANSPGKSLWKRMRDRDEVGRKFRSGLSAFVRSVMKKRTNQHF